MDGSVAKCYPEQCATRYVFRASQYDCTGNLFILTKKKEILNY